VTPRAVAIDLDGALADTTRLWRDWLDTAAPLLGFDASALPEDRVEAAARLDELGAGNWRSLLERFAEERVPLYVRRDPESSSALRSLAVAGAQVGVFTDAPEALARVALAHLGANRRIAALETGKDARRRLLQRLGDDAAVVRTHDELVRASA
jgi:phosphoglycolate phosphatase-like HAD superfamily hydrolase